MKSTVSDSDLDSILDNALEDFIVESNINLKPPKENIPMTDDLAETLKRLSESTEKLNDMKSDEHAFDNLMDQFEKNSNYKSVVEGMMKQVISKEVLYDPMKSMFELYPEWLEKNKSKLSPEEYMTYLKQYGHIEKIIFLYDTKGEEGFDEVLLAMQEMQECGQVPVDIVKQLAPEVEFDPDGQPKLSNAGLPGLEEILKNPEHCVLF